MMLLALSLFLSFSLDVLLIRWLWCVCLQCFSFSINRFQSVLIRKKQQRFFFFLVLFRRSIDTRSKTKIHFEIQDLFLFTEKFSRCEWDFHHICIVVHTLRLISNQEKKNENRLEPALDHRKVNANKSIVFFFVRVFVCWCTFSSFFFALDLLLKTQLN